MLTALRDRPTHLQRFPDGIDGEEIYQKRVPQKHPDYLETCIDHLPVGPHRRRAEGHPSVGDRVGRADGHGHAASVAGALPGHRASRRAAHRPGSAAGHRVSARPAESRSTCCKPLLDELGLVGYPKTSGGRGVHVFLRIKTDWDFIAVRRAGIALAREVERRAPDAVTTSWWKEERGERIFIDFNQNARDRTFASAVFGATHRRSRRCRCRCPGTNCADADPDDYTIATVPDLVAGRDDPWADIDVDRRSRSQPLLEMVAADEERGLGDMPYPPNYPKMPGEPPRVQPSKKVAANWDEEGNPRRRMNPNQPANQ